MKMQEPHRRFDMNCVVRVLVLTILMDIVLLGHCKTYIPLQWSPLNPVFHTTSGNNSNSVYKINVVLSSKFNIICPNPAMNPITIEHPPSKENMFENIWSVDKQSFDTCIVNTSNKKNSMFYKCVEPLKLKYHQMIILPTTNIKGYPEFEVGKDHYFIATSNGSQNSLDNTALGHCHTRHMKFVIYVCINGNDPLCSEKDDTSDKSTDGPSTSSPTKRESGNSAAGRRSERTWLILVCVMGFLLLFSLLCHVILCFRRKKTPTAQLSDLLSY